MVVTVIANKVNVKGEVQMRNPKIFLILGILSLSSFGLGYYKTQRTYQRETSALKNFKSRYHGEKLSQLKKSMKILHKFKNWGLFNEKVKSHISILDAWKLEKGSKDIVVAVIDTGIDFSHPDLKKNKLKKNVYGWDFTTNHANPTDVHGHGTHVAGIIGATLNEEKGTAGVVQNVSLMPIKFYAEGQSGATHLANTIKALHYAVDHGAKIINYSGGGPQFSQAEFNAIKKAEKKGVLIVAAAGNEHQNTDLSQYRYFPAAYPVSNIISVSAIDINNKLLTSSNWGKNTVDVVAPGENIYSTEKHGSFKYMTGTSQATAFVTGIAALMLSKNPNLTPQQIKKMISQTVDPISGLKNQIKSGGRVNAYQALLAVMGKWKNSPLRFNPKLLVQKIGALRLIASP